MFDQSSLMPQEGTVKPRPFSVIFGVTDTKPRLFSSKQHKELAAVVEELNGAFTITWWLHTGHYMLFDTDSKLYQLFMSPEEGPQVKAATFIAPWLVKILRGKAVSTKEAEKELLLAQVAPV